MRTNESFLLQRRHGGVQTGSRQALRIPFGKSHSSSLCMDGLCQSIISLDGYGLSGMEGVITGVPLPLCVRGVAQTDVLG